MAPRAAVRLETLGFKDVRHYKGGKVDWMAAGLPTEGDNALHPRAATVARKGVPTCSLTERLGDVRERVLAAGWDAAVVVDRNQEVLGLLRSKELDKDPDLSMEAAMRPGPSTFRPYVPIQEMAAYMTAHDVENAPITTSSGVLVGLLYRADAVREAADCPECARRMI